jgi:hypothetical protein
LLLRTVVPVKDGYNRIEVCYPLQINRRVFYLELMVLIYQLGWHSG